MEAHSHVGNFLNHEYACKQTVSTIRVVLPPTILGRMSNQRRDQILELLRAHPNGMATLPLAQQLGVTIDSRDYRAVTDILRRMLGRGDVVRTPGARHSTVWVLAPHMHDTAAPPPRPTTLRRGAAELEQARARSAAATISRSQPDRSPEETLQLIESVAEALSCISGRNQWQRSRQRRRL
jgi:hypothetical protein